MTPVTSSDSGDLAELVAAHRTHLSSLRPCSGRCEELDAHHQILTYLEESFRAAQPEGPARPQTPLQAARDKADVLRFEVPGSWRPVLGPLVTAVKRALVNGLRPLHLELMRPQARFNLAAVEVLERLVHLRGAASSSEGAIRRRLEALEDPALFQLRSHRKGVSAALVHATKSSYLRASTLLLAPVLHSQRRFNQTLAHALELAGRRGQGAAVDRLIERATELENPLDALDALPARALNPLWQEIFRRQRDFNREVVVTLRQLTGNARLPVQPPPTCDYDRHIDEVERPFAEATIARAPSLARPPRFSLVTPVFNTPSHLLRACVESVRAQPWDNWELILVNDGSSAPHLAPLVDELARSDSRIRAMHLSSNRGIARATNAALAVSTGDWVAFLDHDDTLNRHALCAIACALADHPAADVIYSDEDRPDEDGRRQRPFYKPDFSPDLLRDVNYICHLLVVKRELLTELGGMREGFDGAQDHDLLLRLSERTGAFVHVPSVLYHWRFRSSSVSGSPQTRGLAASAGQRAVEEHMVRSGEEASVEQTPVGHRIHYTVRDSPLVSLIVPFKDRPDLLEQLVSSLLRTRYSQFELLLISNQSTEPETHGFLSGLTDPRIVQLSWDQPFNYSAINNFGARHARGDVLVFLNNDVEVVDPAWLENLVGHAQRPAVGAVGARLLFPDGTLQHAGVTLGLSGFAGHPFWRMADEPLMTPFGHAHWTRNCLAVTGACLAMRREVFDRVGGFDERFRVCGSDVELCLKVHSAGLRVVYDAHTRLVHHESASRILQAVPDDDHWRSFVAYRPWLQRGDPFYNPNLSLLRTDGSLRTDRRSAETLALEVLRGLLPSAQEAARAAREARSRHLADHLEAFSRPTRRPRTPVPIRGEARPVLRRLRVVLDGSDAASPDLDSLLQILGVLAARSVEIDWVVQGATADQRAIWARRLGKVVRPFPESGECGDLGAVDVLLATHWSNAFSVARANGNHLTAYWVRGQEHLDHASGALSGVAQQALELGLFHVYEGQGVAEAIRPMAPGAGHVLHPLGALREIQQHARRVIQTGALRVGVELRSAKPHPLELAIAALEHAAGQPGLELHILPFGELVELGSPPPRGFQPPYEDLDPVARARFFQSLDLAVVLESGPAVSPRSVELMQAGVPLVCLGNPGTRWLYENGVTALSVEPLVSTISGAITQLARDHQLRQRLAAGARSRTAGLSAERETDRLVPAFGFQLPA